MIDRPKLRCIFCGVMFPRKHGQGLFCSGACSQKHIEQRAEHAEALINAGFSYEDGKFTKNGRSVTFEEVKHVGLGNALAQHAEATAQNGVANPA